MNSGYVKLYRKSIDSSVFQNPELWKLWCLCLMQANHKETWVSFAGIVEPIHVEPGQFITGRFSLHKDYYPKRQKNQKSPYTLWRWLETLQDMGNLSIKTSNKYSIVTIINWGTYQNSESQNVQVNVQQVSNRRATDEQQMSTNKNVKNEKNKDIVEKESRPDNIPYKVIVSYLNEKANTHFKHTTPETKRLIKARWNQGFDLGAFRYVVDVKCNQWACDDKMVSYLRPITLFGNKFEGYLNEAM